MCGIIGVFSTSGKIEESDSNWVRNSLGMLSHRGPNAQGLFVNDYVCFGHTRLSILDTSDASNQPFEDTNKGSVLIFNGEIYNYRELSTQWDLKPKSTGDTEVLSLLCAREDEGWMASLRGMFAFSFFNKNKFIIARDPVGIKPLYYVETKDGLYFCSEIRPLLQLRQKISRDGFAELLKFQSNLESDTFFNDIKRLHPGEIWSFDFTSKIWTKKQSGILKRDYAVREVDRNEAHNAIGTAFRHAVSRRLISDVPVGVFLSGGIDSSAIAFEVARLGAKNVETFTLGFEESSHNEAEQAAQYSKTLGLKNTQVFLNEDQIISHVDEAISSMDYPSADAINTFIVSKYAKAAGLTVCLSGLGGDELFMGYPSAKRARYMTLLRILKNIGVAKLFQSRFAQSMDGFKLKELLDSRLRVEDIIRNARVVFPDGMFSDAMHRHNQNEFSSKNHAQTITLSEFRNYTIPLLLNDADQMGMANAIEIRVPFLDIDFIETVMRIPNAFRTLDRSGVTKRLFVDSLGSEFPEYIYKRKKQGFALPMAKWMRGPLHEYVMESLAYGFHLSWLDRNLVDKMVSSFFKENDDKNWSRIWMITVINRWMNKNGISV